MANIVILEPTKEAPQPNAPYGFTTHLARELAAGFAQEGHVCSVMNRSTPHFQQLLLRQCAEKDTFVFGFDGFGLSVTDGQGQSLYDSCGVPFTAILIDHPANFSYVGRSPNPPQRFGIACVDRSHLDFAELLWGEQIGASIFYFPMGGSGGTALETEEDLSSWQSQRDIQLLFGGTFGGQPEYFRQRWNKEPGLVAQYLNDTADYVLAHPNTPVHQALRQVLQDRGVSFQGHVRQMLLLQLRLVHDYLKYYHRYHVHRVLVEAGLRLTTFGFPHLLDGCPFGRWLDFRPPVSAAEIPQLMAKSHIALNVNADMSEGIHDRVFSGMLNGACVVSEDNSLLSSWFTPEEEISVYSIKNLEALPGQISALLAQPERAYAIAKNGQKKAKDAHTWAMRARYLLEMAKTCGRLYDAQWPGTMY